MDTAEVMKQYSFIKQEWNIHLKPLGIKLPGLYNYAGKKYIQGGLTLVALYSKIGQPVTKDELTDFVQSYFDDLIPDLQATRHLGRQQGWYIVSERRGDGPANITLPKNSYMLVTLKEPYPGWNPERRSGLTNLDWEELKRHYNCECATCGSEEGKPNKKNRIMTTVLQKGHMNPMLPLGPGNVIPQCSECNRAYKDKWIFDATGRVIAPCLLFEVLCYLLNILIILKVLRN